MAGKGGRPPKSTAQHKREGTYNATRHGNRKQFPPLADIPPAPEYFTPWQVEKWNFTCRMLKEDDMLSDRYLSGLELLCNLWLRWWEAKQEVDATGLTFETDSGQRKQNPAVAIEKELMALWLRTLQDFGYTPRAAMSMKSHNSQKQDDDPIMALLNSN